MLGRRRVPEGIITACSIKAISAEDGQDVERPRMYSGGQSGAFNTKLMLEFLWRKLTAQM